MPPRASLTGSFSVTDANNEVICPLRNQDGTHCRKRCLGEKRYRSMQEHIRRAHPEYYLPKLPATKESFELMINTPPHERPAIDPNHANQNRAHQQQHHAHHHAHTPQQQHHVQHSDPSGLSPAFPGFDAGLNSSFEGYHGFGQHDGGYYTAGDAEAAAIYNSMEAQRAGQYDRRGSLLPPAAAAQVLTQLHTYHRHDSDWGPDNMSQNLYVDQNNDLKTNHFNVDPALEDPTFMADHADFPVSSSSDQPNLMSSIGLARSPVDRPSTLPPLQRSLSRQYGRPRKTSLSQQARLAKHERKRSKELARRHSGGRIPEPGTAALGKNWQDLIEAAASATEEEGSRDLTPIPASPYQSPPVVSRTSLPPFALGSQFQSFQASPLTRALTPPAPETGLDDLQPFPSVESSLSSSISHQHHNSAGSTGSQFHIMNPNSLTTPSDSSPLFNAANPSASNSTYHQNGPVQIYCAGCRRLNALKDSLACTNCICGLCQDCVDAIYEGQRRNRMSVCPRCNVLDSTFKPFQLDVR